LLKFSLRIWVWSILHHCTKRTSINIKFNVKYLYRGHKINTRFFSPILQYPHSKHKMLASFLLMVCAIPKCWAWNMHVQQKKLHFGQKICNSYWSALYSKWHCFHMWVLYFMIRSLTILTSNKCQNMHVDHKSWLNLQYLHSRLSFIDIMGSNMIKMVVFLFHAILFIFCISYISRN